MSYSFKPESDFATRGGAAVGMLSELPQAELAAILLLRQWCDGAEGPAQVETGFVQVYGPETGRAFADLMSHLMTLLVTQGRRPMMRHDLRCTCFGGDESAFAQMIMAGAAQDRDDAMGFAMLFLPAGPAFDAAQTATRLAPAILGLARAWTPTHQTRH